MNTTDRAAVGFTTYRLPLSPETSRHALLAVRNDLTADEWSRLTEILDLFRPGLVVTESSEAN